MEHVQVDDGVTFLFSSHPMILPYELTFTLRLKGYEPDDAYIMQP
jgi:hypothetical protein